MKVFSLSKATARMIMDDQLDIYDVLVCAESRIMEGEDVLLQEMYDEVARDNRLHPDDDFEQIIEIMIENITEEFG